MTNDAQIFNPDNLNPTDINNKFFFIDTNIWLWLTYAKSVPDNQNRRRTIIKYTDFISYIKRNGGLLIYSSLIFSELVTNIERIELAEYIHRRNPDFDFKESIGKFYRLKKELRNDNLLRQRVADEVWISLTQIQSLGDIQTSDSFSSFNIQQFTDRIRNTTLDGTDILLTSTAKDEEIINFVTDDADYGSVPGISVYTYNNKLLN